tara:strand:+ start:9679 stop:10899 length:1221 start_codon:yes stop_codon:yes gene_type:complete
MATSADILRSVNQVLQSQESSRRFDVQTALQFMQAENQFRQSKISEARSNLELASKVVQQEKPKIAQNFLTSTGLSGVYIETEEGKPADRSIQKMASNLRGKQYFKKSISKDQADSIATAIWSYYSAQNPDAVLSLASNLYDSSVAIATKQASPEQNDLFDAFTNLGIESGLMELTASAKRAKDSEEYIAQEVTEFASGDYDIQSPISIYKDVPSKTEEALKIMKDRGKTDEELSDIEEQLSDIDAKRDILKGRLKGVTGRRKNSLNLINKKKDVLKSVTSQISAAKALESRGVDLDETQKALIKDEDEVISMINNEIDSLQQSADSDMEQSRELAMLSREEAIRSGEVAMLPGVTHFGIDPLQKAGLWWQTGVWPDDELLRAAEDIAEKKRKSVPQIKWDPPKFR